jgi:hypothetical protein
MKNLFFAITACAAILTLSQATAKLPAPQTGVILLADDGGMLPPPDADPIPPSHVA